MNTPISISKVFARYQVPFSEDSVTLINTLIHLPTSVQMDLLNDLAVEDVFLPGRQEKENLF